MTDEFTISIKNVSMRFNMSTEKVDSLKEYFIKLLQGKSDSLNHLWMLKNCDQVKY